MKGHEGGCTTSVRVAVAKRKANTDDGTTFLIVTRNMALAEQCDRIVDVVDGRVVPSPRLVAV